METYLWQEYLQYLRDWADAHQSSANEGMSPVCYDEWEDNEGMVEAIDSGASGLYDVFFQDLNEETQADLLRLWGDNMNYDVIPIVSLPYYTDSRGEDESPDDIEKYLDEEMQDDAIQYAFFGDGGNSRGGYVGMDKR